MGSVVVDDQDVDDGEDSVVNYEVDAADDLVQSSGVVDDAVDDLAGDVPELSDYREVLAEERVSVVDWEAMDSVQRLERVHEMSYELANSDGDDQLKNDAAECGEMARHMESLAEETLEYYSFSLALEYKLRDIGFLVDEGYDQMHDQSAGQEAVGYVEPEEVQAEYVAEESAVLDTLSEYPEVTGDVAEELLDDTVELASDISDGVVDATLKFGEQAVDQVSELLEDAVELASDISDGVVDATLKFGEQAVDQVSELLEGAVELVDAV